MTKKKPDVKKILFWTLFGLLTVSLIISVILMIEAPSELAAGEADRKVKSDYTLTIFQSAMGIIVLFLPSLVERKAKIEIPDAIYISYIVFLYAAIYLGEVRNYFYRYKNWDTMLHTLSGCMLGSIGFSIVQIFNRHQKSVRLSPGFVAFFSYCFALAMGALWEIFEFAADGILGVNMQKFALEDGTQLVGRAALVDTMDDIIVDSLGALAVCVAGYIYLKKGKAAAAEPAAAQNSEPDKK